MLSLILLVLLTAGAQSAERAAPVIENERVVVRTVTAAVGQSAEGDRSEAAVIVYRSAASLRTPQGMVTRKAGDVVYRPKGPRVREEVVGAPVQMMVVTLKDAAANPVRNASGYPEAFPRPGATKLLENDRVVMWDYTFKPGEPSPMHFHSRDTVVLYTHDGAVTSTTPDGASTVNEHPAGHITFNRGNRTHTETVTRGTVHIIVTELK